MDTSTIGAFMARESGAVGAGYIDVYRLLHQEAVRDKSAELIGAILSSFLNLTESIHSILYPKTGHLTVTEAVVEESVSDVCETLCSMVKNGIVTNDWAVSWARTIISATGVDPRAVEHLVSIMAKKRKRFKREYLGVALTPTVLMIAELPINYVKDSILSDDEEFSAFLAFLD